MTLQELIISHKEKLESCNVCRLTRVQYERMKTVVKELNDFSERHKFDIRKYTKGNKQ